MNALPPTKLPIKFFWDDRQAANGVYIWRLIPQSKLMQITRENGYWTGTCLSELFRVPDSEPIEDVKVKAVDWFFAYLTNITRGLHERLGSSKTDA